MKITNQLTDGAILAEIGHRIVRQRLDFQFTQAELAEEAGLSKRTLERIEAGATAQMSSMIRVLRVLELLEGWEELFPATGARPMDLLKLKGKERQRATSSNRRAGAKKGWSWGDEQ